MSGHDLHLRRAACVLVVLLAGCSGAQQQGAAPSTTEAVPSVASTAPSPAPSATSTPAGPVPLRVSWEIPEVPGYELTDSSVPEVLQLTNVADACLYQLAHDRVPDGTVKAEPADLVAPVLADLGGEETSRSPAVLSTPEGTLEAWEVTFTAVLDGQPAEGVMRVAVPPGTDVLLSATYVCSGSVAEATWQELAEGTEVAVS